MIPSLIILWVVTLVLALAVLFLGRAYLRCDEALRSLKADFRGRFEKVVGSTVPSFEATTIDGKRRFTDHDIRGRSTLLVFLSPTCNHCHIVMEQLVAEAPRWQNEKRLILGVSNGDSAQMMKFASRYGANFPILAQEQWELSQLFQVSSTPWGIAITPSGLVATSGVMGTPEQLQALLDATDAAAPIY